MGNSFGSSMSLVYIYLYTTPHHTAQYSSARGANVNACRGCRLHTVCNISIPLYSVKEARCCCILNFAFVFRPAAAIVIDSPMARQPVVVQ